MSTPEWPATLPYQCEAGGSESRPSRAQPETEMEGGNVRLRQRPGDRLRTEPWSRRLAPEAYSVWSAFLAATLAQGTRRFLMPVWTGTPAGDGYELRLVQISGGAGGVSETPTGRGLYMHVSFSLLVFPAEMVAPPAITVFDRFILGTGIAGWSVDIEVDGVVHTAPVGSDGRFVLDGAFLSVGTHAVRIANTGSAYGPSQNYTVAAAAGGLFDALSAALWDGYSTARLLTAWLGPVVRARRFDNAEKDFYALTVSPWLVDSAGIGIAEWAGIGPAYIARWYGQKGLLHDAVQATASAQPRIVNAGVLDVGPNGRPQLVFSGAQYLDIQNSLGFSRNQAALTYGAIARATGAAGQTVLYWPIASTGASVRGFFGYSPNSTVPLNQTRTTDAATAFSQAGASVVSGAWSRIIGRGRYAAGAIDICVNGVVATNSTMAPAQATPNSDQAANVRIGATGAGLAYLAGGISMVVLAQSEVDMAALNAAQLQVMP